MEHFFFFFFYKRFKQVTAKGKKAMKKGNSEIVINSYSGCRHQKVSVFWSFQITKSIDRML